MDKNFKVWIKNLSAFTIFYKALSHLLVKFEQIETLRNMQQNLLLTGKSFKMGIAGHFYFCNVAQTPIRLFRNPLQ